jgi:hypothetical protein
MISDPHNLPGAPRGKTNKIPAGTRNFTLNLPAEELALWGRKATQAAAKSVNRFIKTMAGVGLSLKDRVAGMELHQIRRRFYGDRAGRDTVPHEHTVRESRDEFVESI